MSRGSDPEVARMQMRLSGFLREHPEKGLSRNLAKAIQDPLKPITDNGRLRINPLLLILTAIVLFAVVLFLFFTLGEP
jgi:hypothetical protein